MGILLLFAAFMLVGYIFWIYSAHMLHKSVKQYMNKMQRINEAMDRLKKEFDANMIELEKTIENISKTNT